MVEGGAGPANTDCGVGLWWKKGVLGSKNPGDDPFTSVNNVTVCN